MSWNSSTMTRRQRAASTALTEGLDLKRSLAMDKTSSKEARPRARRLALTLS